MFTLVTCFFASFLIGTGGQTTNVPNWYTALVPVNIKCNADPVKGLVCAAEYAEKCKEEWNFPNPCTVENMNMNMTKFIHPFDTTKFLMCGDLGKLYVVRCPQYEVFHEGCGQCVGEGSGFDASCEIPLTPMIKNPCTKARILANELFFAFPGNLNKFIHCDVWGKAWERTCTVDQVWSQYDVACVPPMSVNPCSRPNADTNLLYQHPCNPYKYLRCDINGAAYEVMCPEATAFIDASQTCQPLNSLSYQPEVYCRHHIFNFRTYDASLELGVPKGIPAAAGMTLGTPNSIIDQSGAVTRIGSQTVSVVNTSPIVQQERPAVMNLGMSTGLKAIVDAWQTNVNVPPNKQGTGVGSGITISRNFAEALRRSAEALPDGGSLKIGPIEIATRTGNVKNVGLESSTGTGPFEIISGPITHISPNIIEPASTAGELGRAPDGTIASVTDISGSFNPLSSMAAGMTGSGVQSNIVSNTNEGSLIMNGMTRTISDIQPVGDLGFAATGDMMTKPANPTDNLGESTIHPAQLKDYVFSIKRWSEPCTPDNILNGRFHFKLTGDPHSYLQCDAHGNMFKMPCSRDETSMGWFDVYTSTCVDGPVHLPQESMPQSTIPNSTFSNIFFDPFPAKEPILV